MAHEPDRAAAETSGPEAAPEPPGGRHTVARFSVSYTAILSPEGTLLGELPAFAKDPKVLISLYRALVRTRTLDAKAVSLQRTGRLGTYGSSLGQEAIGVGVASAMRQ